VKYHIVQEETVTELTSEVNKMIDIGFMPCGGIAVKIIQRGTLMDRIYYLQAVVKEESKR